MGLPPGHPGSYREVIRREFTGRVNISPENVHGPDGEASDVPATCRAFEEAIRAAGGVDLQLLGLGTDGHIGFNEPGSSLASRTGSKPWWSRRGATTPAFSATSRRCRTMSLPRPGHHPRSPHVILLATGAQNAQAVGTWWRARWPRSARPRCCNCIRTSRSAGRGRGVLAATRRLLPAQLRQQAALAGPVTAPKCPTADAAVAILSDPAAKMVGMTSMTDPALENDPANDPMRELSGAGTSTATIEREELRQEVEPGDRERFSHYVRKEKIMESGPVGGACYRPLRQGVDARPRPEEVPRLPRVQRGL